MWIWENKNMFWYTHSKSLISVSQTNHIQAQGVPLPFHLFQNLISWKVFNKGQKLPVAVAMCCLGGLGACYFQFLRYQRAHCHSGTNIVWSERLKSGFRLKISLKLKCRLKVKVYLVKLLKGNWKIERFC